MNSNMELLNYIHQNSEMGQNTIKQLIELVEGNPFKEVLQSQFNEYKKIFDLSEQKIEDQNKKVSLIFLNL